MKILPAVDLKGGKVVQLVGGKPGTERVQLDDAVAVARNWQSEDAEMIHIIDLDSALGTGNNEHLIEKIIGDIDIPVQVGGGVRTKEKVDRLFELGCERVILGTRAIEERRFIEDVSREYTDGIVVALDSKADQILVKGWQESSGRELLATASDLEALPIWGFLHTNVEVEGKMEGIDPVPVKALLETVKKPVIVSGGITTEDDLEMLRELGAHSVVVGMAIYTGRMNFRKIVREFR